jgi:hypothetical protein
MPLNRPALDSRGYRDIVTVVVMISTLALTIAYPDSMPVASSIIQPGASALRDSSILVIRSVVNTLVWGLLAYILMRVSERLRHKGR